MNLLKRFFVLNYLLFFMKGVFIMKTKLLILSLLIMSSNSILSEIDGNPCLIIPMWAQNEYEIWHTPEDSIVVDTCRDKNQEICLNKAMMLYVKTNIFYYDTLTLKGIYQWYDIKDSLKKTKEMFKKIYNNFSEFQFEYDTLNVYRTEYSPYYFRMYFKNWVYMDSLFFYYELENDDNLSDFVYHFCGTVGISENLKVYNELINLDIYPNPSCSQIILKIKEDSYSKSKILIYNLLGIKQKEIQYELVLGENSITFDVSDLSSGVYFVVVNDGKEVRKQMFIKE